MRKRRNAWAGRPSTGLESACFESCSQASRQEVGHIKRGMSVSPMPFCLNGFDDDGACAQFAPLR